MAAAIALPAARIAEMGRAAKARALARHDIDAIAATLKRHFAEAIADPEAP
jgi:acetyl-CoA carboxylase carboxyltransferase component